MDAKSIEDVNVASEYIVVTPDQLKSAIPASENAKRVVRESRSTIRNILDRRDHRLLVVVGPCSIHDPIAAVEYAGNLANLARRLKDTLYIVMRVYFEKPRTTVGWKGLINDPHLDNSFRIDEGIQLARNLLLRVVELGLPAATEALDPISPQYLQDLISWSAIGARTTESQTHREMASGLSSVVGFKNGTDGSLTVAINALKSVSSAHHFLGINGRGQVAVIKTKGNRYGHMVLRGGELGPNYGEASVAQCEILLRESGLAPNLMIDCSHANSNKDPSLQPIVVNDIADQILAGNQSIVGLMLESNLVAGNQKLEPGKINLQYGLSITDSCIDWQTTERCLVDLAHDLESALPPRVQSFDCEIAS